MIKAKLLLAAVLSLSVTGVAAETSFPTKPIRIIVPYLAGGSTDVSARLVAGKMEEYLGQTVIVENRPGGDSLIGTRAVASARPDGYTLLVTADSFSLLPALKNNLGYDSMKDFIGIGPIVSAPLIMNVPGDLPVSNAQEFITYAKESGDNFSYVVPGIGTPNHAFSEMFFEKVDIEKRVTIPFNGGSAAIIEVASGRIPLFFSDYVSSAPHIATGRLKPLAVTSDERMSALPDVPSLTEQGVDLDYEYWLGMLVRAGTPPDVVQKLSAALHHALQDEAVSKKFKDDGNNINLISPEEFTAQIHAEIPAYTQLLEQLGIEKN